jgi:UDP-N-acetylglucosamine 2-epimerase (non-hydrolysing)
LKTGLRFHPPFGFNDYIKLQKSAKLVLSDSGTISEESLILKFPAVTLRDFIERPEALDAGGITTTGLNSADIINSIEIALEEYESEGPAAPPWEYKLSDTSRRVVNFIRSSAHSHDQRAGIRRLERAGSI